MNEPIIAKSIKKGKLYKTEVDREKFLKIMESIRDGFQEDNEISTIFCKIIPEISEILINEDRNKNLDVPFVTYEIGGEKKVLKIIRHHKIIWAILNVYCEE